MMSIGRNRRLAPPSTVSVYASASTHYDRERSRTVLASRLSRWAFGFAAIAALAACGQQNSSTPASNAGAATAAATPAINLQLTPSSVSMGQSATLRVEDSAGTHSDPRGFPHDDHQTRQLHPDLDREQCGKMLGARRMARAGRDQRHVVDRYPVQQY